MKYMKMFMTLAMLSIAPLLFSAPVVKEVGNSEIIVELKSNSQMSSYDLGFSATPVTQWSTKATPVRDRIPLVPVLDPKTGGFRATFDEQKGDALYVYWRLYSLDSITFSLEILGPMKNGNDRLHWYVDWDNPESKNNPKLASTKGDRGPLTVYTYIPLLTLQGVAGSKQINVYTDNLLEKSTVGTYKADLQLKVVVN